MRHDPIPGGVDLGGNRRVPEFIRPNQRSDPERQEVDDHGHNHNQETKGTT